MKDISIFCSTSHKGWAIHYLAVLYKNTFTNYQFKSKIILLPFSRRQLNYVRRSWVLPRSKVGLFMQQDLALQMYKRNQFKNIREVVVRFTHLNYDIEIYKDVINQAAGVIVENSQNLELLKKFGVENERLRVLPHPVDETIFRNSKVKTERDVILVSNFYYRKNPDLILKVIKGAPDITFTIYGKGWSRFGQYKELSALPNLELLKFNFQDYPNQLCRHKVFLSLSLKESGPVPLLEALATGLNAVSTDVGTARDLIKRKERILPIDAEPKEVELAIREAIVGPSEVFDVGPYTVGAHLEDLKNYIGNFLISEN